MEIGGYKAQRRIGRGATGGVWRATAPDGTPVALKVFDGPYAAALQAAKREAALAAQVDHPHLLTAAAVVCDSETVALAFPLATGGSLAQLLARRGRLRPAEVVTVLIPIASALATAHERGVVHGDLSPANIVFDGTGRPLLTDLGAARVAVECGIDVLATPGYVAPEVARGSTPDAASDVFGLGAVALQCLSGRAAWNADDLRDVVVQSTVGQWPDPEDGDGPAGLVAAIRSMLVDVPHQRPGAAALAIELSRSIRPEPVDLVSAPTETGSVTDTDAALSTDVPMPSVEGDGESIAQQRILRARTRLRADAPRRVAAADRARSPAAGSRGRSPLRVAAIAVAVVVVGALAVQGGLLWAGADRPKGSAAPPVSAAAPVPSPLRSTTLPVPTAVAQPAWSQVAADLDRARAVALTQRDPHLLDRVYTTDAPPRKLDAATISQLADRGLTVSGAEHRIVSVRVIAQGATVRLEVTDVLPSYRVLNAAGAAVGTTPARDRGRRVLDLVRTADGYRIADVRTV